MPFGRSILERTTVHAMADLLDSIERDINARLEELRPFVEEASGLQRAVDALDGSLPASERHQRVPSQSASRGSKSSQRSPRGHMRAAVIEHVRVHPGSTAG